MKKLLIGLTLITFFITTSSFDGHKDKLPNNAVLKTFQREFKNATDIRWTEDQDVMTAMFNLEYAHLLAFFNPDGMLLGTARSILFNQLPLLPFKELSNRFQNSSFYDLSEYTIGQDLYYVLTVETETKKMEVKVLPSGDIYIRKTKKISRNNTF